MHRRGESAFPLCTETDSRCICPAHECTLGNATTVSIDVPESVGKLHRVLAHAPTRLHCKRRNCKPTSTMMWRVVLPELLLLRFIGARRRPSSLLGSHSLSTALAFLRAILSGEAPPLIGSCWQRRPGTRRLPRCNAWGVLVISRTFSQTIPSLVMAATRALDVHGRGG